MSKNLAQLIDASLKEAKSTPAFTDKKVMTESGGKRKLRAVRVPNRAMRILHKRFRKRLLALEVDYQSSFGSHAGKSTFQNVAVHAGNRFFFKCDIRGAYKSVPLYRLASLLAAALGDEREVREFLHFYCGDRGGLATGAPASPTLFNLYCAQTIDPAIRSLLTHAGTHYTRYLDDLVISSPEPISFRFRKAVRSAVENAGFAVNHDRGKSAYVDRWRESVTITGITITKKGLLMPSRHFLDSIIDLLSDPPPLIPSEHWLQVAHGLCNYLFQFDRDLAPPGVRDLQERCRRYLAPFNRAEDVVEPRLASRRVGENDLELMRRVIPIVDVVGQRVALKKRGRVYWALCPFHREKTPSFKAENARKTYHCFGCGAGGDIFKFVIETEGWTFREAVHVLAERYGIPLS